jgi:hypothetical protein
LAVSTPPATFEYVWHTFNDYYAFFNERGIDWDEQYSEFELYVNDELSNDDLIELLEALLEPLDDGHIQLNTADDSYSFDEYRGANRVIFDSFQGQTEYADIQDYADAVSSKYKEIRSSYLDTEKSAGGEDSNAVIWGTIYHRLTTMKILLFESKL